LGLLKKEGRRRKQIAIREDSTSDRAYSEAIADLDQVSKQQQRIEALAQLESRLSFCSQYALFDQLEVLSIGFA